MKNDDNNAPAKAAPEAPDAAQKMLDIASVVSYPVGAVLGYQVGAASVRDEATKNLSHSGVLDDLQNARRKAGAKLQKEMLSANKRPIEQISADLKEVEKTFYRARRDRFEQAGVKNIRDYWGHLRPSEKFGAIIQGATVSSIIIGAVILMTQSKVIFENLLGSKDDVGNSR